MPASRDEIPQEEVVHTLWRKYTKSREFRQSGRKKSISSVHPLVEDAEKKGLGRILHQFINKLKQEPLLRKNYESREPQEWVEEWCAMHKLLLELVYRDRGRLRPKGYDVRFGNPGDEARHNIPLGGGQTQNESLMLAKQLTEDLRSVKALNIDSVCTYLAQVHYGFIRIHPFHDGNGRIARALTDQLGVSLGYPPVITGYPRLDEDKKRAYHAAIDGCVGDPSRKSLKLWIQNQIERKLAELA